MPRLKSPAQQDISERLSNHRSSMALYRTALTQYLDRVSMDRVEVDEDRCIVRSMNVTSKRLTRNVINAIIDTCLNTVQGMHPGMMVTLDVLAYLQVELRTQCDTVTCRGNLVATSSTEAKRITRGGEALRRGGCDLLDNPTRDLCEAMWEEMGHRTGLVVEGKAMKKIELSIATCTKGKDISISPMIGVDQVRLQSPLPSTTPRKTVTATSPSTGESIKPKSSISKTQAFALFQLVSAYIVEHNLDECLVESLVKIVDGWWPVTAAETRS